MRERDTPLFQKIGPKRLRFIPKSTERETLTADRFRAKLGLRVVLQATESNADECSAKPTATAQCAERELSAMGRTLPTLTRAWPQEGPVAAICVQSVDVQCVLQFTLIHAAGCVLHRRTSRVIHRLKLYFGLWKKNSRRQRQMSSELVLVDKRIFFLKG